MKSHIIVAVPNTWMHLSVIDIIGRAKEQYTQAKSLTDLYMKVKEGTNSIVLIDILSYEGSYRDILQCLRQQNPDMPVICLLSHDKLEYAHYLRGDANCYLVEKEKADKILLPVLKKAREDRQKQLPTLNKKEVKIMDRLGFKSKINTTLTRRNFLKASAVTVAATGVIVSNPLASGMKALAVGENQPTASENKLVSSVCRSNCFQCCRLYAHVQDGKIFKTTPAAYPDDIYTGCCIKGLSLVQRTYSSTRIKYPMRRVGERGEDKWERISWDEAINEIAEKFMTIQSKYGSQALVVDTGSGNYGLVHGVQGVVNRLANSIGCTRLNICYDQATGYGSDRVIGGGVWLWGNEPRTMLDSKTIIVWGSNPINAQPQNWRIVKEAQKKGAKVITIDPIYTATANKSDEYIPVVPGSDAMLTLAMIKYIIDNDLHNIDFMKKRSTAPFLVRKDNGKILRKSDFTPVDPAEDDYYVWDSMANKPVLLKEGAQDVAIEGSFSVNGVEVDTTFTVLRNHVQQYTLEKASEVTSIPVEKIKYLVKTYVSGPTTIYTNYGINHYQNGHLWSFAAFIMASLTGNIGVKGAGFTGLYVLFMPVNYGGVYVTNGKMANNTLPQAFFHQVMKDQMWSGKPYPLKGLFTINSNSMSNFAQQNVWFDDILPNLEFKVVVDTEFTDNARYADIVLPAAFWFEVNDLRVSYNNPYMLYQEKVIEPLYESKPDAEIIALIGRKMGLGQFFPESMDDTKWIQVLLDSDGFRRMNVTYERLVAEKVIRVAGSAEKPFIRGENLFFTPSGRAQLYCENPMPRVDYGQDVSEEIIKKERLPYFRPPSEAWKDNPLFAKYPLVFLQELARFRTHSQWYNTPVLRELDPEPLAKMNREDADTRGIKNGDIVEVFNDRGKAVLKVEVNDAISKGVLSIPKGWQREQFIEGCLQELTNTEVDPMSVNFAYFDCLVDVRKV